VDISSSLQMVRYAGIVIRKFWVLLVGGAVVVGALGIYERYVEKPVSWNTFLWVAIVCAFSALFGTGFSEWRRGVPCLVIGDLAVQPWLDEQGSCVAFWFSVTNSSSTNTITNVKAKLVAIEPPQPNLDWLPVPLFIKHSQGKAQSDSFSLNPGESQGIDFVSAVQGGIISLAHTVAGVNRSLSGTGRFRLTVEITGQDVSPVRARFDVSLNQGTGLLECVRI
jgi:hypothetical protein